MALESNGALWHRRTLPILKYRLIQLINTLKYIINMIFGSICSCLLVLVVDGIWAVCMMLTGDPAAGVLTDILLLCLTCWLAVWPTWNALCEHYLNNWRVNASFPTSRSFHLLHKNILSGENRRSSVPAVTHEGVTRTDSCLGRCLAEAHSPPPLRIPHQPLLLCITLMFLFLYFKVIFKIFSRKHVMPRTPQKRATFINRMFVLRPIRIRCQQVLDPSRSSDSKRNSHGKAWRRRWWVTSLVGALVKGLQQTAANFVSKLHVPLTHISSNAHTWYPAVITPSYVTRMVRQLSIVFTDTVQWHYALMTPCEIRREKQSSNSMWWLCISYQQIICKHKNIHIKS